MSHELPISRGETLFMSVTELAERYVEHIARLGDHQRGRDDLLPGGVREHMLAALACQHRLLEEVTAGRWLLVAEALAHGATVEQAARAAGLDRGELVFGLSRWAASQRQIGQLTDAQLDEVLALIEGVDR